MGVLNVTPDSFSDGGRYAEPRAWRARIDAMLEEGADVIDVGGESTRPGAARVATEEQLARVLAPIAYAACERGAAVSIDTTDSAVAAASLDAGASIVNDVSCLADVALATVAHAHRAALIVMHSRGAMAAMRASSTWPDDAYDDVVEDVVRELSAARDRAIAAGLPGEDVLVDPGLGFHKNARHSYRLLARLEELAPLGRIVVGASRKSFLAQGARGAADERLGASVAAALLAADRGASIVRVHDVRATRDALSVRARTRAELAG